MTVNPGSSQARTHKNAQNPVEGDAIASEMAIGASREGLADGIVNAVPAVEQVDGLKGLTGIGGTSAAGPHAAGTRAQDEQGSKTEAHVPPANAAAEHTESDALVDRQWIHESGYGGKAGQPRVSSDQREAAEHTVHLGEWPEFSPDMLPSGTDVSPVSNPHPDRPHIVNKSKE